MLVSPEIYCDYDSTLGMLLTPWIRWINKKYGSSFELKDVTSWGWFYEVEKEYGFDVFGFFKENEPYCLEHGIKPINGSKDFYEQLNALHKTFILTATHCETLITPKNAHIENYYGTRNVIHHHNKSDFAVQGTTGRPNILIDDSPENCIRWVKRGGVAFLYTHGKKYPYATINNEDMHHRLYVADTYSEITDKIESWGRVVA